MGLDLQRGAFLGGRGDDNTHDMFQCSARDPDHPSDLVCLVHIQAAVSRVHFFGNLPSFLFTINYYHLTLSILMSSLFEKTNHFDLATNYNLPRLHCNFIESCIV